LRVCITSDDCLEVRERSFAIAQDDKLAAKVDKLAAKVGKLAAKVDKLAAKVDKLAAKVGKLAWAQKKSHLASMIQAHDPGGSLTTCPSLSFKSFTRGQSS